MKEISYSRNYTLYRTHNILCPYMNGVSIALKEKFPIYVGGINCLMCKHCRGITFKKSSKIKQSYGILCDKDENLLVRDNNQKIPSRFILIEKHYIGPNLYPFL